MIMTNELYVGNKLAMSYKLKLVTNFMYHIVKKLKRIAIPLQLDDQLRWCLNTNVVFYLYKQFMLKKSNLNIADM